MPRLTSVLKDAEIDIMINTGCIYGAVPLNQQINV